MRKATPPGQHIRLVQRFVRFPYIARISRAAPPSRSREAYKALRMDTVSRAASP